MFGGIKFSGIQDRRGVKDGQKAPLVSLKTLFALFGGTWLAYSRGKGRQAGNTATSSGCRRILG